MTNSDPYELPNCKWSLNGGNTTEISGDFPENTPFRERSVNQAVT